MTTSTDQVHTEGLPVPKIHAAMIRVMSAVQFISKNRKNAGQGYNFRGVDDVYEAVQPELVKNGVYTTSKILSERSEEKTSKSGSLLIYRILLIEYTFWSSEDGSSVTTQVIGEGQDSGDKASNKAMSVAHKYAFLQALCVPTAEPKDPENDSHDLDGKQQEMDRAREDRGQVSRPTELSERHLDALAGFTELGIPKDTLEKIVNKPFDQIGEVEFKALRVKYDDVRSGRISAKDLIATFSTPKPASRLSQLFTGTKSGGAPGVGSGK